MSYKFDSVQLDLPETQKDRQTIPDWLKGVAIVLMVYGHVTHVGSASFLQKNIVSIIYTFHMPLFLVISGFFLNTTKNINVALKGLFRGIVLPYFIFISLYLFGLILVQQVGIHTNNAPPISMIDFLDIVFIHPRGGYWFLHSLLLLQLSILASRYLVSRSNQEVPLANIVSICLIALVCKFGLLLPRTAVFFLVGMAMRKFSNLLPASVYTGLLLLIIIVLVGAEDIFTFSLVQTAWVMSILLVLAGLGLVLSNTAFFSMMSWVGCNSLIVLLLHAIFVVILKPLARPFLLGDSSGVSYSIMVTLIAVYGSLTVAKFLDQLRWSRIIFGADKIFIIRK